MNKRLYRNEHDKIIAGVSSGLADYMQVDVKIIRLLFVLATIFLAGMGLLAYIILWIIAPVNNDPMAKFNKFNDYFNKNQHNSSMFNSPNAFSNPHNTGDQTKWNTPNAGFGTPNENFDAGKFQNNNDTGRTVGGLVLLILGFYFLLRQFDLIPSWLNIFKIYKLWPLAIVALGVSLIFRNQRKTEWDTFKKNNEAAPNSNNSTTVEDATVIKDDQESATPNA